MSAGPGETRLDAGQAEALAEAIEERVAAAPRPYVIDTSVALKWYIPENLRAEALRYLEPGVDRHAPDYLHAEAGGALLKRVRSADRTRHLPLADARAVLTALEAAPVQLHPTVSWNGLAFVLAEEIGSSHYDGLFLALAVQLGGQVVTADKPFYDKIKASAYAAYGRRVEDPP